MQPPQTHQTLCWYRFASCRGPPKGTVPLGAPGNLVVNPTVTILKTRVLSTLRKSTYFTANGLLVDYLTGAAAEPSGQKHMRKPFFVWSCTSRTQRIGCYFIQNKI